MSLAATASGDAPLTYQWSRNGSVITGATSAALSLASLKAADAGTYTLMLAWIEDALGKDEPEPLPVEPSDPAQADHPEPTAG